MRTRRGSSSGCRSGRELRRSINDGIWSLYSFLLFFFIMIMWKPSENSSEYAYHIQVASNAAAVGLVSLADA